jgi:hypothetical protein
MYLAEKEANPEKFSNFADALWWGVVSCSFLPAGRFLFFLFVSFLISFFGSEKFSRLPCRRWATVTRSQSLGKAN